MTNSTTLKKEKKNATKPKTVSTEPLYSDDTLCKNGFFPLVLDQKIRNNRKIWGNTTTCCLLCLKGKAVFTMDGLQREIKTGDALIIGSEFFLQNISVSRDFKAYAIEAAKLFLFSSTFPLALDLHFFILRNPVMSLPQNVFRQLTEIFEIFLEKSELRESEPIFAQNAFNSNIMGYLAKTFCYELYNQYNKQIPYRKAETKPSNRETLVLRYIHLLYQYAIQERRIAFYATALDITPQYLATILKGVTGLSSNQWMHTMIIEKAKHLILTQNQSLQEVAKSLCFPDQSTFGKMFKSETGMSPIHFKKEVSRK